MTPNDTGSSSRAVREERREQLLEQLEQKVKSGEITVGEVREKLEKESGSSREESLREKLEQMEAVKKVAEELPEDCSAKITHEGHVTLFGLKESPSYKPDFVERPRDADDWAFYVDGELVGWNSMSGGLSKIKGYRCSPSKIIGGRWDEFKRHELQLENPKRHEQYDVVIISQERFFNSDREDV